VDDYDRRPYAKSSGLSPGAARRGPSRRELLKSSGLAAAAGAIAHIPGAASAARGIPELDPSYKYYCPELVEITAPGPIILPDGSSQCSWSRRPYLDLNFEHARFYAIPWFQRFRMKKWDMYHLVTPECYLSFLVAWIGYGAFCSAYVFDRASGQGSEDIHISPPRPGPKMMRDSTTGRTEYQSRGTSARFEVEGERRSARVSWPAFAGKNLDARIEMRLPAAHESICGVHPTSPRRCHYGHKINCMEASGSVRLGGRTYDLDPVDSFGMLDFGRGYFPPRLFWYWAVASGRDVKGRPVGWNLGHGNSPAETAENAVFYDGRLHKIGKVKCVAPAGPDDPWRVLSDEGRVDLSMVPKAVRNLKLNLGVAYSIGRSDLGLYSGTVTLDSGEVVEIADMFGLFEWVDQKW